MNRRYTVARWNTGFETGAYPPWLTIGNNSVIDALGPIASPAGSFQSLSQTGGAGVVSASALEVFLGVSPGALSGLGNGTAVEGSAIRQTFAVAAGETVSFLWNFLTDEVKFLGNVVNGNDFSFYVLDGAIVELADIEENFPLSFVPATGTGFARQTGFFTLNLFFATAGVHTLAFGVVDEGNAVVNSGLLVDAAEVPAAVPEPASLLLLGSREREQEVPHASP